jgi:DNA (cytosine-5)-methyltransferase 1
MNHLGLFEGIGGFSLAARWMGWKTVAWCEWNEFGQKVLRHHFPEAEGHGDITKTDFTKYHGAIDIISGGFPCQPYSSAGKRLGKEDDRHLWPEMLRVIREVQPTWVVGENVFGLVNWSGGLVFDEVQSDLEAQGYEVQPYVLPAVSVNAPHRRDRVWFVAKNTNNNGWRCNKWEKESKEWKQWNTCSGDNEFLSSHNEKIRTDSDTKSKRSLRLSIRKIEKFSINGGISSNGDASDTISSRWQNRLHGRGKDGEWQTCKFGNLHKEQNRKWEKFPTVSPICNGDDGLSNRLDSITFSKWRAESIKAGGNAIVPQVAYQIFKSIEEYEKRF